MSVPRVLITALHQLPALSALSFAVTATAATPELAFKDGWVRAMPPGQPMTAGYGTLTNTTRNAMTLTAISSDSARDVSMHETVATVTGNAMQAVPSITLAPGESVSLEPGGMHLMLMGMDSTPAAGEEVSVCFAYTFEASNAEGEECHAVPVSRGKPAVHHHHH